jgi:hypothetical protein
VFSSAELIEALRKRARKSLRPERPPGEFPPGWQAWFASIGERLGRITGATSDAIVAIFLQRELASPPRRVGELNRWQAFATLWRQQWQPPAQEDRAARIAAYAITFILHVLLLLILLWLASVRMAGTSAPQGEEVVQVEYIGTGTPEDTGGGPPSGEPEQPTAAASAAASPAPAPASASPATAAVGTPPSPATQEPVQPQPPAAAQPLQVTEVPVPDMPFVLTPPNPQVVDIPRPVLETPQLQSPTQVVDIVETQPAVQAIKPQLPQVAITVPQLQQQAAEVTLREASKPLPQVQAQALPEQPIHAPAQSLPGLREIPMPAASATAAAATSGQGNAAGAKPTQGNAPTAAAAKPGGTPSPSSGTQPGTTASGSGKTPAAKPGAFPTPQRGDDWGASTRNRPGGNTGKQPGLFNADGSPHLPPGVRPTPGGGSPPGTIEQDIANLDRAGTWLRRAPNDFEPTSFDKYWAPNETLLAEWVRKNIREVSIPIPGTSKKLRCVVSLLQLGGGCGITDPNMQDQEAVARPPPDIPFKPELQEDQDALRKPPPGGP